MSVPPQLQDIAASLDQVPPPTATLREVLRWFEAPKLTVALRWKIQKAFEEMGVLTLPGLEDARLDTPLEFRPDGVALRTPGRLPRQRGPGAGVGGCAAGRPRSPGQNVRDLASPSGRPAEEPTPAPVAPPIAAPAPAPPPAGADASGHRPASWLGEVALQLKHLDEIHRPLESIGPDELLKAAKSKLALNKLPFLAVLKSERSAVGVCGWQELGRAELRSRAPERVVEVARPVPLVQDEDSLLDVLPKIEQEGAVLVLSTDRKVIALLTAADAAKALHRSSAPYLLLGEIERRLRALIEARLPQVLQNSAHDAVGPTCGDYLRILENPDNWNKFAPRLERSVVVRRLDDVRRIRNACMHFALDDVNPGDLRAFLDFLRLLRDD